MRASTFWKAVTMDEADLLGKLLALFRRRGIRFCIIGGQGVNAYVEPVVSLDLGVVVAADQLAGIEAALAGYRVERFAHSLNVSLPGSDLRVQIQTDPRYPPFVERATPQEVLGHTLPVAALEDVLQGKIWAAADKTRRASKRQKDLADIARLIEAHPRLRDRVPKDLLDRLV
jgi:Nucleotidyl transferase AbiEii toxin, Type IV TA system